MRLFVFLTELMQTAVPLFLLLGGSFLLFRFRHLLLRRPHLPRRRPKRQEKNGVSSSLRALLMALAGTLGVGNITGVSLAIATAGAGAVFWMWISALFAMVLKYAEVVLALLFRPKSEDERVGLSAGGAMYYMKNGLGGRAGGCTAAVFAVLCLFAAFSVGGALQSNAVAEALFEGFSLSPVLVGAAIALLTAVAVSGGAARVEAVTFRLVPFAALLYAGLMGAVILCHADAVGAAFAAIFRDAFTVKSASGGILGFLTSRALRAGVSGGLLSNEAGAGSAPMAHVRAHGSTPVRQGLFGICEVAIDTFFFCTLTAVGILAAFPEAGGGGGGALALTAITDVFGAAAPLLYTAAIAVFAFATILCWSYYGENCILWFTKERKFVRIYRILFCAVLFFGASVTLGELVAFTDLVLAGMTWLNVTVLLLLSDTVKRESERHLEE